MDQGSPEPLNTGSIIPRAFRLPLFALASSTQREPGVPYCIICGRPGRFVNPFQLRR
jgi:hypothetical protein